MTWDERAERRAFVRRVLHRMEIEGLTRQELADRIGSSRSSVSVQLDPSADAWMAGDKMLRLAPALGCNAHWLLTGQGSEIPPGPDYERKLRAEGGRDVLERMRKLLDQLDAALTPPPGRR